MVIVPTTAALVAFLWLGGPQAAPAGGGNAPQPPAGNTTPPASTPATQPATGATGEDRPAEPAADARLPRQAEIFRALIEERESAARPIEPVRPERPSAGGSRAASADAPMLEGEQIVNRAVKLVRSSGRSEVIVAGQDGGPNRSYPILESQLLEVIEREADAGVEEFVITAEAKLYRGRNYLLLLKVMRRVPNGNVTP